MHTNASQRSDDGHDNRAGTDRRQVHANDLLAFRNRRDGTTGDRRQSGTSDPTTMPDRGWRTRLARRLHQIVFRRDLQPS